MLPDARLRMLPGIGHNVKMDVLAPVLRRLHSRGLEGLTAAERRALDAVLRKLLTAVEEAPRG